MSAQITRRLLLQFLTGAAVTTLAACTRPARMPSEQRETIFDRPVEILLWHVQSGPNGEAFRALIERFNATNGKQITVREEIPGNYARLYEKAMVAIAAGTPPDVATVYESMVSDFMRGDAVVPLDEYVQRTMSRQSREDIFEAYWETNRFPQFGNKMLSFPFTKSLLVLYFNHDALREAGIEPPRAGAFWTWEQFRQAAAATTRDAGKLGACPSCDEQYRRAGVAVPSTPSEGVIGWAVSVSASTMVGWMFSRGGTPLTGDFTRVRFNDMSMVESLEFVADLLRRGYAYSTGRSYQYQTDFALGRTVLTMQSSTGRPFFRADMEKASSRFQWGISMIPQANPRQPKTVMYGANVAVFKSTPLRQAAGWEFIRWFTERDQTVEWAIKSSYMPIRKSAAQSPELQKHWESDPQGRQAFELIQYSHPEPNISGWQEVRPILEDALIAVLEGRSAPRAALDEATEKANALLAQRR